METTVLLDQILSSLPSFNPSIISEAMLFELNYARRTDGLQAAHIHTLYTLPHKGCMRFCDASSTAATLTKTLKLVKYIAGCNFYCTFVKVFHGIRFKVKGLFVVRQVIFFCVELNFLIL